MELDSQVKDLEVAVLDRREELMQLELNLEQLRKDHVVAFADEAARIDELIEDQRIKMEQAKVCHQVRHLLRPQGQAQLAREPRRVGQARPRHTRWRRAGCDAPRP